MEKRTHNVTEEMKIKMVELYKEGYSTVEIGKKMSCSYETVRYHLIKKEIAVRKNGEGVALKTKKEKQNLNYKNYSKIPLTKGKYALVDKENFDELNEDNWCTSNERNNFYAVRKAKKGENGWIDGNNSKSIRMQRQILHAPDGMHVDHINGNTLDNRKSNLRIVTNRQNQQNKHIFKTSKYPGVHWEDSRKKWHASIRINGKKTFLGRFDIEEDAYSAYKKAVESIGEKVI
jgi:frataxin-like iron-binding protein CyaY